MAKPYTLILRTGKTTIEIPLLTYHLANENTVIDCPITDADLLRAVMSHYPALSDMAKRAKAYLDFDNAQLEDEYEQAMKSLAHQQEFVAKVERKRENKSELRQLFELIGELE